MTRRGAVLACLLAPFGAQYSGQNLQLTPTISTARLILYFTKTPKDKMLEVVWSDGGKTVLTEAEIRQSLED